jgi:L-ascorbate metabolism protein UlaG (beta-lactamase superfamily)
MRITYVGHATLLIEVAGVRILTDPNFDLALAGFLPRVAPPGVAIHSLPRLDALLLTHAHADHLSFDSLNRLPRDVPLYAPPAVERWLRKLGYTHAVPLAPDEAVAVRGVTIRAAAAKHLGNRYGVDRWRSAANMYLLEAERATCFFAGDTALTEDSHRMVEKHVTGRGQKLDVALLPIGHAPWWKPRYRTGHMTTDDALTLFERLDARYMIPYHWGVFRHVTSGPYDAITRLRARLGGYRLENGVKIIEPGATFELPLEQERRSAAGDQRSDQPAVPDR